MDEDLDLLETEGVRPELDDLDERPIAQLVRLLVDAEREAQAAVSAAVPRISAVAEAIAERLGRGGRLFYLGAGTAGRLAVLDAAELAPTFSLPPGRVIALIAGGPAAMTRAAEGSEDDTEAAADELRAHELAAADAVVGVTASGRTPYVLGGLEHARRLGALTAAVVNNLGSPAVALAEHVVELRTGPEVIAGSTRLTAGTAQKMVLNAISTSVMVRLGKTYGARMVDLAATNAKLRRRALRIVREVTGASAEAAEAALRDAGGHAKTAIVAILWGIGAHEAERRLADAGGRVRAALLDKTAKAHDRR